MRSRKFRRSEGSRVSETVDEKKAPGPLRRPPALHDVGRLAGVSHQTVSRVLNNHPMVKSETRDKVLAAISELGYRRNTAARALVTRKSAIIGVIKTASLLAPSGTLMSIEWAARDAGYFVSVASLRLEDRASLDRSLDHFMSQSAEGIVVIAPQDFAVDAVSAAAGQIPIVLVSADAPTAPNMHSVFVDQAAGAELAVSHLADLGHRNIAHVSGPTDWFDARSRITGWQESLARLGLPPGQLIHGDWTAESGYQAGMELLKTGLPDAIFAANDEMALGLLHAFRKNGVSVPGTISIVGFDNVAGSAYFDPPLTTVRQDFEALGVLAMRTLQDLLTPAGQPPLSNRIRPTLIVRESSARR